MATQIKARKRMKPSLQPDSINLDLPHVERIEKVNQIISAAETEGRLILGGTPSTGKTSLLELLKSRVEKNGDDVYQVDMSKDVTIANRIKQVLREEYSIIAANRKETERVFAERTNKLWILIDEAQKAYTQGFEPFWTLLVKTFVKWNLGGKLVVVISSTYDVTLGGSPAAFAKIKHVTPHASYQEALDLYNLYAEIFPHTKEWLDFRGDLINVSWLAKAKVELDGDSAMADADNAVMADAHADDESDEFHVGVIMCSLPYVK